MGPSQAQQRVLIPLTAMITFFAGLFLSQGRTSLVVGMMLALVIGWIVTAVFKIGEGSGR